MRRGYFYKHGCGTTVLAARIYENRIRNIIQWLFGLQDMDLGFLMKYSYFVEVVI